MSNRIAAAALIFAAALPGIAQADPPIVPLAVFTTIELKAVVTLACPRSTTTLNVELGTVAKFYGTGSCRLTGTALAGGKSYVIKALDVSPSTSKSSSRTIERSSAGEYSFR